MPNPIAIGPKKRNLFNPKVILKIAAVSQNVAGLVKVERGG